MLLADNQPSYILSVVRESVEDLDATLAELQALVPISQSDLENFHKKLKRQRPSEAVPLRFRLTEEERARLAVNRFRLPGVVVEAQLLRYYPHGELFSHALGYVGRINEQEAQELDETDYRGTFHVGKVGVEKFYEDILHGDVGYQNVESNAHGRVLRVLERFAPATGKDLTLSLDYRVQRAAFEAMGDRRGAVVAIDPRTGGLLALVSTPGFDTNLFVNGISSSEYAALRDSLDVPLFNRAIQGTYPPGSTIKPFMAMAGLQSGLVTPETTVADPGWYSLPGDSHRYRDWILRVRGTGHAPRVAMKMAIAESCDVYFYDLARRLTIDRMAEYLHPFGFGERTGIDTTNERAGVLPSTRWKRAAMASVLVSRRNDQRRDRSGLYAGVAPAIGGCHERHCKQGAALGPAFGDGRGWRAGAATTTGTTEGPGRVLGCGIRRYARGGARPKRYGQGIGRWDYL